MARTKNSGTPHKRSDGTWVQWLTFTGANDTVIRKKVEGKTKQQVIDKVAKLRALHRDGVDLSKKPPLFREYFTAWLTDTYARSGVKPRSVATYRQIGRDYLIPAFGEMRLDQIPAPRIRKALAELEDQGYAAKTIGLCRTVLRGMFGQAVDDELLPRSPMLAVKSPKTEESPAKSMTPAEAQRFRTAARAHRLALGLELALILGLRRGEVSGLKWDDVDLDKGILYIRRSAQYIPDGEGSGAIIEGSPKTKNGKRMLKLSPALLAAFHTHRERLQLERETMQGRWRPDEGYVFVAVSHGGQLNPSMLYTAFQEVCTAAGISGYRLHDLRHSTASLLFAEGTSAKLVSHALGHANTNITQNLYTHLLPGALDTIAETVERLLDSVEEQQS